MYIYHIDGRFRVLVPMIREFDGRHFKILIFYEMGETRYSSQGEAIPVIIFWAILNYLIYS